jgi:glutamate-1-semialdehyde 2,1-aminomutase
MNVGSDRDRQALLNELVGAEVERFSQLRPGSYAACRRAVRTMPLGVPTGVCSLDPYPIVIAYGLGAYLTDIDANRYVDYHNGFGTTVMGHAHPAVVAAGSERLRRGTHFGAMTEPVIPWAEHLCERYGLDWIRFSGSGTEATMDALRLARAATGRTKVAKIEGGYHGSHATALVSNNLPLDGSEGADDRPAARPCGEGLSPHVLTETVVLPFNNLAAARRELSGGQVAALLIEPILMNVGTIWPVDGYLQALRELCDQTGTLLIFDETKTGATVAWGGASELFGVAPHIRTLGKGIGGGAPVGAFGGTDSSLFELIESWRVPHLGTFSGNPLTAAMGLATMTEVLTPEAHLGLQQHYEELAARLRDVIAEYQLPA